MGGFWAGDLLQTDDWERSPGPGRQRRGPWRARRRRRGGGGLERVGKSVRTVETEWEKCVRWGEGEGIKKKV